MKPALWDMHVHLDFMRQPDEIAAEAAQLGIGLFAVTVTPDGYEFIAESLQETDNVCLGAGLHPWWIADGRCGIKDVTHLSECIQRTRFVGEIGLDASSKHVPEGSLKLQAQAFEVICRACAESSSRNARKILSIHSVRAASLTLDILERAGCLDNCSCIFHWFTGSNEELIRALRSGCMFSVNEMMLRTRRGREYARQIPSDRLLLETDLPPGENVPFTAAEIKAALERTLNELTHIRGSEMFDVICGNASRIIQ